MKSLLAERRLLELSVALGAQSWNKSDFPFEPLVDHHLSAREEEIHGANEIERSHIQIKQFKECQL